MNTKKLLCIILCFLLLITTFSGCNSAEDYVIYFELDEAPKTLDPQLVSTDSEKLIVRNIFEGLMRENEKGEIVPAVAENHTISKDKLTYTFNISDDAKWSDGENVTAHDFVFAFKRALDPVSKAPSVALLFNIKNAKEFNSQVKGATPQVIAKDDSTLVITLASPDDSFLKILTNPICMPCRQDVFEKAKGRYGKTIDDILGNGSFKMRFWEKEEKFSLRLNRNDEYSGNFVAETTAVIFNINSIADRSAKIEADNLDMGFINYSDATDKINKQTFQKTTYSLIINNDSPLANEKIKEAFSLSIHRNRLINDLPKSLSTAECLIPESILLNKNSIINSITIPALSEYNPDKAHERYVAGAKEIKDLPKALTLVYYGDDEVKTLVNIVAETFRESLGVVVNISAKNSAQELFSTIQANNYHLAIVPFTAKSADVYDFLESFTSQSANNYYSIKNSKIDSAIEKITPSANEKTIIDSTSEVLKEISNIGNIIPLATYTECFAYSKNFSCPKVSPFNGILDLALIKKVQ